MINRNYLEIIFSIIFITLSVVLNLQFLEGSNINTIIAGHDEYIAVKEVYSIVHPVSFKHFFMALISGNALYYGRIMFYLDAVIAWLPFKVWGVTGMILAVRLTHSFLILISFLILANTFLKSKWQKAIFYLGGFCLYCTMYFIMMPKPEPWQLLFLALFLNRFKNSHWSFGWHFILLGIAYGLKFNMLLILPLLFLIPVIRSGKWMIAENFVPALKSFGFLILGLIIAIPCLALSPLRPIFLKTYLHETFGGTVKGYDDSSLTFLHWMESGLGGSYLGMGFLSYSFIIVVLWFIYKSVLRIKIEKDFSGLLLLVAGLILTLVIMLKTNRLWPHYLWTGYILMLLGILTELGFVSNLKERKYWILVVSCFCASSFFFYLTRELPLYLGLSQRKEVQVNSDWSHQAIEYIRNKEGINHTGTDGSLLYPFEDFVKVDIFHPFAGSLSKMNESTFTWYWDFPERIWDDSNKYVVFYKRHPERMMREHPNVYVGRHEELYRVYKSRTQKDFVRDTSFGEIIIYRRK